MFYQQQAGASASTGATSRMWLESPREVTGARWGVGVMHTSAHHRLYFMQQYYTLVQTSDQMQQHGRKQQSNLILYQIKRNGRCFQSV
jgi:hypothetical protein